MPEDHRCQHCSAWASFGSRDLRTNVRTWYCATHLPDTYGLPPEAMAAIKALARPEGFDAHFEREWLNGSTPALAAPGCASLDWEGL